MSFLSEILSPEADPYWYWARYILGFIVAVTVVGESVHHVPKSWLPKKFRSETTHHEISKGAWAILVIALALEVPVEMARDSIEAAQMNSFAGNLEREHVSHMPRHLDANQQQRWQQRWLNGLNCRIRLKDKASRFFQQPIALNLQL
jgi:hypothetical protein